MTKRVTAQTESPDAARRPVSVKGLSRIACRQGIYVECILSGTAKYEHANFTL